ncbi:MAG: TonB-dependent receptor, partial [Hymenobacteraceae bacterium]|nr:TonB-dependent receptor [Hymenobacteraceae bacterium]MDX5396301.1 TonB-dependent receptor [Hymenobacteraceae bacterium]MDX5512360.1 TonB-dependent receptor [Hymenobacteraceae bacterium]
IPFFRSHTLGVFWLEKWRKDNLQLEAGVRFDSKNLEIIKREKEDIISPNYQFTNFSGTVGAAYDWGYHVTLSGNATSAWRAPSANELFSDGVHHGAATFEKGNPELVSEKAYNTEITFQYHSNRSLNGEISVYQNYINDFINLVPVLPATLTIRGAFPTYKYQQTDAVFRGVDLSWSFVFTDKLLLESKSSLVRARDRKQDEYLLQIPADRTDNTLRYSFGNEAKRFRNMYVALGGLFVAKQTHLPEGDSLDYAPAPDGYFLLHAEAGATLMLGQQPVQLGLTGTNLLNNSYRDYLNRFRYYADEAGRMLTLRATVVF